MHADLRHFQLQCTGNRFYFKAQLSPLKFVALPKLDFPRNLGDLIACLPLKHEWSCAKGQSHKTHLGTW